MKNIKYLFFFALVLASVFLGACQTVSNDEAQKLAEEVHAWVEENVKEAVTKDIELPTAYPDDSRVTISWVSNDPSYMDDEGHILSRDKRIYEVYFNYYVKIGDFQVEYEKLFKLSPRTLEEGEERFKKQFPIGSFISRDIDVQTTYFEVMNVTWWSSNQEVFSNEGKYTKLLEDSMITISYIITDGTYSIENSFEIKVQGKTPYDYFLEASDYMESQVITDLYVTEDLVLPTTVLSNEKIKITWSSTNEDIVSSTGKVTKTMYERFCKLTAKLEMDGSSSLYEYDLVVAAKDISNMSEAEMLDEFLSNIAVPEYKRIAFLTYPNNTQSYGFINFYSTKKLNIKEGLIPEDHKENRPGTIRTSTEYITVHDTANSGASSDAQMHYNYVLGSEARQKQVSWHYVVDEDVTYRNIPDKEVAYHAGDGGRRFALLDTGIRATGRIPVVTLKDGYYCLNGQKTNLRPYVRDDNGVEYVDTTNWTTDKINEMGIQVEVGANGNWYMGKTWYSKSYGLIGNYGGNYNSIGIESCVNAGSDYATTVRHLALLVAQLCVENDLPVTRVKGHHFFSGKGCPNQMMNANYWEEFKNLVALEKFALEHFSDYTFTWTSLSSSVDSTGKIAMSAKAGDEIKYSVVVKNGSKAVVKSATYSTILK